MRYSLITISWKLEKINSSNADVENDVNMRHCVTNHYSFHYQMEQVQTEIYWPKGFYFNANEIQILCAEYH